MITVAVLAVLPWFAWPAETADMYAAETVVADEGSDTRNAALSGLLAEVLVRVSGNAGIAGQPAARELINMAPSLVQQYRYRSADRDGETVRYLWARFDQPVVDRLMRERNLPVWASRPRVLLWIATESGGQRSLLNLDNEAEARVALQAQAQRRGLPLQLPLLDLEDQAQLTPADVWSNYQPGIRQASARYPHDLIVTGRLRSQAKGRWAGTWSILGRDASQDFQTPPQTLADGLASAVDQTQNLLAARYAPIAGPAGGSGTLVRFSDVYDLAAYGRLVGLLDSLGTVAQVALRHVDDASFTFEFQLRGGEQELVRALEGSGQLVAEPGPPPQPITTPPVVPGGAAAPVTFEPQPDLYYRLIY